MTTDDSPLPRPTLGEATAVWARIGLLSFGGPAGQIALMHKELVEERRWISNERFLHALNFCMLLPGPEAQQLATYVGWLLHGTRGGLVAGTLFVLPGFLVILALSAAYVSFQQTAWLPGLFFGLKAAVLAIVVEALIRISGRALATPVQVAVAALAFLAIYVAQVPFPLIIVMAGIVGYLGSRSMPRWFPAVSHNASEATGVVDQLSVDAKGGIGRNVRILALWGAVWAMPVALLVALFGTDTVFVPIATFFSKMAVVTFGGAYAVLAYVAQQVVEIYGWLKPGEMLDGLALAETTPGPLVLVLTFVGFLAAFRAPGLLDPMASGLLGATVTAWVTFAPCFLWIFLGAPYVERLRYNRPLAAAMATITAAVVGVILNLTIWFALHVLFRSVDALDLGPLAPAWPDLASVDPSALCLSALAAVLLFRFSAGMIPTLAICGAAGLTIHFFIL